MAATGAGWVGCVGTGLSRTWADPVPAVSGDGPGSLPDIAGIEISAGAEVAGLGAVGNGSASGVQAVSAGCTTKVSEDTGTAASSSATGTKESDRSAAPSARSVAAAGGAGARPSTAGTISNGLEAVPGGKGIGVCSCALCRIAAPAMNTGTPPCNTGAPRRACPAAWAEGADVGWMDGAMLGAAAAKGDCAVPGGAATASPESALMSPARSALKAPSVVWVAVGATAPAGTAGTPAFCGRIWAERMSMADVPIGGSALQCKQRARFKPGCIGRDQGCPADSCRSHRAGHAGMGSFCRVPLLAGP